MEKTLILILDEGQLHELVRIADQGDFTEALAFVRRSLAPKARKSLAGG